MIQISPYRPRRLVGGEDLAPEFAGGVALALACHKGDTKGDTQTSEQQGAQTQGVAAKGNANISQTGTNVATAPQVFGSGTVDTGPKLTATSGGVVNVTDQGAVNDSLSALSQALAGSQTLLSQAGGSLANLASAAIAPTPVTPPAAAPAAPSALSGILARIGKFSPTEWLLIVGLPGGLLLLLYFLKRKKRA